MISCLAVGAGGFVGAVFRYLLSGLPAGNSGFPMMTMIINIVGALVIGVITGVIDELNIGNNNLVLFLKVGICGGFTTFSTYSLELNGLIEKQKYSMAVTYGALSVLLCLAAVFAGKLLGRAIASQAL